MTVERNQVGWAFGFVWTLITTMGWWIGIITGSLIAELPTDVNFGMLLAIFLLAFWPSTLIGALQWLYLRRKIPISARWILASTACLAIGGGGGLVILLVITVLGGSMGDIDILFCSNISMAFGGAVVGIWQWDILRDHVPQAQWWVLASTVGWGLSTTMLSAVSYYGEIDCFVFVLTCCLHGGITGATLVWLLRLPVPESKLEVESS